jgi:hypothetical protein
VSPSTSALLGMAVMKSWIFSGVVIRRKIAVSSAVSPMSRASRVSNAMNPTMPNFADSRSGKIVLYSEHL